MSNDDANDDDASDAKTTSPIRSRAAVTRPLASIEDARPKNALAIGTVLGGRYRLISQLGAGGMGSVYKAEHLGLGTLVAVKTLHPYVAANPESMRRFRREAHAASLLVHPNVMRVIDFDASGPLPFLAMEYAAGPTLADWVFELIHPPKLAEVASVMGMIFDALAVAHTFGIVHRDLKPENVIFTEPIDGLPPPAGGRVVKLTDFGLAHVDDPRDLGPTLTARDAVAGTPDYMSPEQCRSLRVGPSSDLYSAGCVLTVLLQQTPPFTAASPVELLSKHMFATPPPLRRSESSEPIPPALERLRLELLAKRPEQRPKSATDAREQLFAAMSSPEAVGRKSAVAALPREERAPELATPPLAAPRDGEAQHIGLIRQGEREGLSASDAVGLAAHGVELVALSKLADAERVSAVIVDAADDAAFATRTIVALRALEKPPLVVVCARAIEVIDINALVAAGAADVIRLPATAEAIARRALRVVRRRR